MRRPPLAARRVLVVAPHADDETIGAWALMRALRRRGARVDVVVVTDGAASHPNSVAWPPVRLIAERRRETLRAMATLAIRADHVRFLALPDGRLAASVPTLDQALARGLRRRPPPDLIVGPSPDDAHPDHAAVARRLARIRRRGERRIAYRVWPADADRGGRGPRVALDGRAMAIKRRTVLGYRTQAGAITDAEAGFAMTSRHLSAFVRPRERFEPLA